MPILSAAQLSDTQRMKTRVAVPSNPHRFEILQLRDAAKRAPSPMFKDIIPLGNARRRFNRKKHCKWASAYNLSILTHFKSPTQSRRSPNENVYFPPTHNKQTLSTMPIPSNIPHIHTRPIFEKARPSNIPPVATLGSRKSILKASKSSIPTTATSTRIPTSPHFKSASLSSVASSIPSPTRPSAHRIANHSEDFSPRRSQSMSARRRAIYAQSLLVSSLDTAFEQPSFASVTHSSPRATATRRLESPPESEKFNDSTTLVAYDACEIIIKPSLPHSSSLPSMYSQESFKSSKHKRRSRHSQGSRKSVSFEEPIRESCYVQEFSIAVPVTLEKDNKVDGHHPIIIELLVALDMALKEWQFE
ncbi:hypothetical protein BDZ89DRAFT_1136703 [Hymenopellis radicata]|nr:hypothetical protein BDZ89DRAFT_1136703 [Hymenopellis radicata]